MQRFVRVCCTLSVCTFLLSGKGNAECMLTKKSTEHALSLTVSSDFPRVA